MRNGQSLPLVSLVVPVRNEAETIDACIGSVVGQQYPRDRLEIIVVDGASDDGTARLLAQWVRRDARIRVLSNPQRLMVPGLNLGIRSANGTVVGCVSGHSILPPDYIAKCLRLMDTVGAWAVGGFCERVGHTTLQRAIGRAQSHPFGVGDSFHNYGRVPGWVDAVFPGMWPAWVFERIGDFDEAMLYNEDNEFSQRILAAGGRIWYEPTVRILYAPRRTLMDLFAQYHRYGRGKPALFRKHPRSLRMRHLAPAALVALVILGPTLGVRIPQLRMASFAAASTYALAASTAAARGAESIRMAGWMMLAFGAMHAGYGTGMWRGFLEALRKSMHLTSRDGDRKGRRTNSASDGSGGGA